MGCAYVNEKTHITKARKWLLAMHAVAVKEICRTLVLSVTDYRFGLMTLADTNLKRLDLV